MKKINDLRPMFRLLLNKTIEIKTNYGRSTPYYSAVRFFKEKGFIWTVSNPLTKILLNDISSIDNRLLELYLETDNTKYLLFLLNRNGHKSNKLLKALSIFQYRMKNGYRNSYDDIIVV